MPWVLLPIQTLFPVSNAIDRMSLLRIPSANFGGVVFATLNVFHDGTLVPPPVMPIT